MPRSSAPTIMIRDLRGKIYSWNPTAEENYGWRRDQAVGKISHSLLETIFPEPLDEINNKLQEQGYWEGELIHKLKDGRFVRVKSTWELQPDDMSRPKVFEFNDEFRDYSPRLVCLHSEKRRRSQIAEPVQLRDVRQRIMSFMLRRWPWWLLPALAVVLFGIAVIYLFGSSGKIIVRV